MAEEVQIDKSQFHERLNHFISAWKADKRSSDGVFGSVGSIAIVLGKLENAEYQKSNALHVRRYALS